jgi:hypothetical protein
MLTCTTCWELYRSSSGTILDGYSCPKRDCQGHVADIDELLLPAIVLLNEKGYMTKNCCSGHFHAGTSDSAYIQFEETVEQEDLPVLPKGFKFDTGNQNLVCIRRELRAKDQFDLHRKAVESSIDVLEWARTIEPCSDCE